MLTAIRDQMLALLVPLLVAPLAVLFGKLALNVDRRVDALPAEAKQFVVLLIAAVLTYVGQTFVPGLVPDGVDASLLTADWQAFAAWLAALVLHGNHAKPKAPPRA